MEEGWQMVFLLNLDSFFTRAAAISLLAVAVCSGCSSKGREAPQDEEIDLLSLVSVQIPGWQEEETMLMSKAEDMLKYMDGGAELYFAYGFRRLAVKKYKNEKALSMLVEVYEFDSSENAYGIYSFDTVGDKLDIGQDAVYGYGLLKFWKGKVLVRVLAEEEYQGLEEDVLAFGRQIDPKILTEGSRPDLLSLVSEENLVPDSLHFFHKNICLNNIHYIPESTALGLSEQTDAVTAQYTLGEGRPPRLLLVKYPDESEAGTAFEKFGASYFQGEPIFADRRINILSMGEEEYSSISLNRNFVILVFDARYPDLCKKLTAATSAKIELYGRR
jgi:hypothetical protein